MCLCLVLGCMVIVEDSATPRFNIQLVVFLNAGCVQCAYYMYHLLQVVHPYCIQ